MYRPNILFSTTRTWNPGDDFILMGVLNLFDSLIQNYNPVIYNRNPALHNFRVHFNRDKVVKLGDATFKANHLYSSITNRLGFKDNSWRQDIDINFIDFAVFSGTPEWCGDLTRPLAEALLRTNIPTIFFGIGSYEKLVNLDLSKLPVRDQKLLKNTLLLTVRDDLCAKILSPLHSTRYPCPALFSSNTESLRSNRKRIELSTQGFVGRNS